jgi:hypothetical protein
MLNMAKPKQTRKQLFRAALALAGMSAKKWCELNEVTDGHLWQVLRGERVSVSLTEKVDQFIDKHLISKNALVA